jgi:hypothetical protein
MYLFMYVHMFMNSIRIKQATETNAWKQNWSESYLIKYLGALMTLMYVHTAMYMYVPAYLHLKLNNVTNINVKRIEVFTYACDNWQN